MKSCKLDKYNYIFHTDNVGLDLHIGNLVYEKYAYRHIGKLMYRWNTTYLYNHTGESSSQQYPTWSQVAIRTSVAEKVVSSGKALDTSSLILWITSLSVVTLYHREPKYPVYKSVQNGAISGVLIGNESGDQSENPLLKERSPLLFNYM